MIQDVNLYEGMRRFFDSLPTYILGADEQVELVWMARGENQPIHRECFPDLKQASARAIALGPARNVFLQAVVEPGTTPWNTDSTQLLASWTDAPGRRGSGGVATLQPLPNAEPSLVCFEYFSDGVTTCAAGWFYYRSRCPERARLRARSQSPLSRGDEPGEERD